MLEVISSWVLLTTYSILITFVFVVISVEYSYYLLFSLDKDLVIISFDKSRVVYVSDSINSEQI